MVRRWGTQRARIPSTPPRRLVAGHPTRPTPPQHPSDPLPQAGTWPCCSGRALPVGLEGGSHCSSVWRHGGGGLGSRQWMPGALVKRTADLGWGYAPGNVGPGRYPSLLPAGAQAWARAVAASPQVRGRAGERPHELELIGLNPGGQEGRAASGGLLAGGASGWLGGIHHRHARHHRAHHTSCAGGFGV
jgi:hypothetical protein